MSETEAPTVLVCTVGGSPDPIRTALRLLRPDAVWFLVSEARDGTASSRSQVEGDMGLIHAEGCPAAAVVQEVPADDPDRTFALCRSHLKEIRRRYPDHRIVADYTGGTKSMTGGLLMAAFAEPGIVVQFMRGARRDLHQVESGTEQPCTMPADFIAAERIRQEAVQAVKARDYEAARRILGELKERVGRLAGARPPKAWRAEVEFGGRWCSVMSAWDAFRHKDAWRLVRDWHGDGSLDRTLDATGHLEPLRQLAQVDRRPDWRLCADLWLNAQRRAERGRYDDAIARLYRLVEAAGQARLRARYGLDSKEIPWSELPETMRSACRPKQTYDGRQVAELALASLMAFLRLRDAGDPVASRFGEKGPDWLGMRNRSILAHGFRTVAPAEWQRAQDWVASHLREFWAEAEFSQLPDALPAISG